MGLLSIPDNINLTHILLTSSLIAATTLLVLHRRDLRQATPISRSSSDQLRRLGVEHSNIADEYTYTPSATSDRIRIKSLWLYPVKSARGVEVKEAEIIPTGFQYDREFMFAEWKENQKNGPGWVFLTQRLHPKLALVTPTLFVPKSSSSDPDSGYMTITFPTPTKPFPFSLLTALTTSFTVPLSQQATSHLPLTTSEIWKDKPLTRDLGSLFPKELEQLRQFLSIKGSKLTLLRTVPDLYVETGGDHEKAGNGALREVLRCAPRKEEIGYQCVVGFQDAYPLHIQNLASVRELNGRVEKDIEKLSVRRFRANIIVEGPKAYEEDDWKLLDIGGAKYHCACRTIRCKLPNTDPDTGIRHRNEPDVTMRKYRNIDKGYPMGACMGMQVVSDAPTGTIKVGDELKVLESGELVYEPLYPL